MTSFEVYFLTSRTVNEDFFVSCSCMVQNIIIPLVIFQLNSDICDKILYTRCVKYINRMLITIGIVIYSPI